MNSGNNGNPSLCAAGCGFYGSAKNKNLCSKCYEDFLSREMAKRRISIFLTAQPDPPSADLSSNTRTATTSTVNGGDGECDRNGRAKNRCKKCNKKVGLTGFACRCGEMFCGSHRYPEEHSCNFDYKTAGRQILGKHNQLCTGDKLHHRI